VGPARNHSSGLHDYAVEELPYHLAAVHQVRALRALLFDLEWMQAKLKRTDVARLIADYEFDSGRDASTIVKALRQSANTLREDRNQLLPQLFGRLMGTRSPLIRRLVHRIQRSVPTPWLRPLRGCFDDPSGCLVRALPGIDSWGHAIAVSHDGRQVVVCGSEGKLQLVEIETGAVLWSVATTPSSINSIAVCRNGTCLIGGSDDGAVRVWDLANGRVTHVLRRRGAVVSHIAITPNDGLAIWGDWNGVITVWDFAVGQKVQERKGHGRPITALTCSDSRVVTGSKDGSVRIWTLPDLRRIHVLPCPGARCESAAIIPGGQLVLAGCADHRIRIWDIDTGQLKRRLSGHTDGVRAVTVTRDGRLGLSAGKDQTVRAWDLRTGLERSDLRLTVPNLSALALTPDSEHVLTASQDSALLKIWRFTTGGGTRASDGHAGTVQRVIMAGSGRYAISTGDDNDLLVWGTRRAKLRRRFAQHWGRIRGIAALPRSDAFVSVSEDQTIRLWDINGGRLIRTLGEGRTPYCSLAIAPDGRHAFVGVWGALEVWDLKCGGRVRTLGVGSNMPWQVILTRGGERVIAALGDGTIRVLDNSSGQVLHVLDAHHPTVTDLELIPSDRAIVTTSLDGTAHVWDLRSGKRRRSLQRHRTHVMAVASSRLRLVTADANGEVISWSTRRGMVTRRLIGHGQAVWAVSVRQDGRYAVSASQDATIRLWSLDRGRQVASYHADHSFRCCVMAPDGRTVVAGDDGGQVHFLRIEGVS
jgi:WD40 repeat protein